MHTTMQLQWQCCGNHSPIFTREQISTVKPLNHAIKWAIEQWLEHGFEDIKLKAKDKNMRRRVNEYMRRSS